MPLLTRVLRSSRSRSDFSTKHSYRLFRVVAFVAILSGGLQATIASGQDSNAANSETASDGSGIELLEPTVERWEMGLEITGGSGNASGIVAMAPLPVDWPEQTIRIITEDKTDNVGRLTFKTLDDAVTQMMIPVSRLGPGDVAKVVVTIEVTKHWIAAPNDTSQLQFGRSLDRHVRKFLAPSPYIESRDRRIKEIADELERQTEGQPAWNQVEAIFDWVRDNVEYRFDEQIKSCVAALDDGHGDCEELSSLFIAICRARGIPARAVWIPGHTYPEFYLEDEQGNGHWFPCQAAGTREFGAMSEDKPILQKGDRFKIHGHRDMMRYVQPTLTARDATASPTVRWILNPKVDQ